MLRDPKGMPPSVTCTPIHLAPRYSIGELLPGFKSVCTVRGDLSTVANSSPEKIGPNGVFYKIRFEVGISFGRHTAKRLLPLVGGCEFS